MTLHALCGPMDANGRSCSYSRDGLKLLGGAVNFLEISRYTA